MVSLTAVEGFKWIENGAVSLLSDHLKAIESVVGHMTVRTRATLERLVRKFGSVD